MEGQRIEPHKITKPIQLMAVWLIALLLIDSLFLTAAAKISTPQWVAPMLAISAIVFVPLFLSGVFLMQTVFRKELQDDQYYSECLKREAEIFKDFKPENESPSKKKIVAVTAGAILTTEPTQIEPATGLEQKRKERYVENMCMFLVHSWRPSQTPGQVADIVIWVHQHDKGPLSDGKVEKVEYQLGPKFFACPKIKTNAHEFFKLEVSAYGPFLCIARVFIQGEDMPVLLERYINFEDAPNKSLQPTAGRRD